MFSKINQRLGVSFELFGINFFKKRLVVKLLINEIEKIMDHFRNKCFKSVSK